MKTPSASKTTSAAGGLEAAASGDSELWGARLNDLRPRLKRIVAFRMDHRLKGRIDASDVIQEALLEATRRRDEFARDPKLSLFIWLRFLAAQQLQLHHRRHLGAQARDAAREVRIYGGSIPEATSAALAAHLLGRDTRVSEAAMRAERAQRLQEALNSMDAIDREVLAMRHFEELTNAEVAMTLKIQESAASKRYVRALRKLKEILNAMSPDGTEGFL